MSKVNLGAGAPKKGRQHIEAFLEMISPPRPKPQDAGKIVLNPKKMREIAEKRHSVAVAKRQAAKKRQIAQVKGM